MCWYFANELVSGYRVEGFTEVYGCKKYALRLSRIARAMCVRRVFVEWLRLKPFWAGESGTHM